VSLPPTLLPTPEQTYVPSKHTTPHMVDNGYWPAVAETPPQEDSDTSPWSPPPSVSRTVKKMETQMDTASEWLQQDSLPSPSWATPGSASSPSAYMVPPPDPTSSVTCADGMNTVISSHSDWAVQYNHSRIPL
jgi:hypothetical protein